MVDHMEMLQSVRNYLCACECVLKLPGLVPNICTHLLLQAPHTELLDYFFILLLPESHHVILSQQELKSHTFILQKKKKTCYFHFCVKPTKLLH